MKSFAKKLSFTSEWFCLSPRLETIAASQCFLKLCRSQGLPRIQELVRVPQGLSGSQDLSHSPSRGRTAKGAGEDPGTCLGMWDGNRLRLGWAVRGWHGDLDHGQGMGSPEDTVQGQSGLLVPSVP